MTGSTPDGHGADGPAVDLTDRVVLVTGGSMGLGRAIAHQLLARGAAVTICSRSPDELADTERALGAELGHDRLLAARCDVAVEAEINEVVAATVRRFGALTTVVCNAGVYGPMGPLEQVDLGEWRKAVDINLFGVLLTCRAAIPHLKAARRGKIIVISGGGATSPMPFITAYAATKAAAVRLAESLAEELRSFEIDVNAVAPGALATRLVDEVLAAGPDLVGQSFYDKNKAWKDDGATPTSLGASLVAYLASDLSNGITGKLISAQWDPWPRLHVFRDELERTDIYTLRRIVPADRGIELD